VLHLRARYYRRCCCALRRSMKGRSTANPSAARRAQITPILNDHGAYHTRTSLAPGGTMKPRKAAVHFDRAKRVAVRFDVPSRPERLAC